MPFPAEAPTLGTTVIAASGNLTLVEPAGSVSGDLLVACIAYRSNAAFTLPAGWTICGTQQSSGNTIVNNSGGDSIASAVMAYIIRGGSAPSYAFTRTAGDVALGRVLRYPGTWAASTLDVASSNTAAAGSTAVTTATMTTTKDSDLLVAMAAGCRFSGAWSAMFAATDPKNPSGGANDSTVPPSIDWAERVDTGSSTGADVTLGVFDAIKLSAGATGTLSATQLSCRGAMIVASFKNASIDLAEERASKVVGYAVIPAIVTNLEISKVAGYAVLAPVDVRASKVTAYGVLGPRNDRISTPKVTAYGVLGPRNDRITVPKVTAYAIIRAIPFVPPPHGSGAGGGGTGGGGKKDNPGQAKKEKGPPTSPIGIQALLARRARKRFVIPLLATSPIIDIVASDSALVLLGEAGTVLVTLSRSDSAILTLAETAEIVAALVRSDATAVLLTEVAVILAALERNDDMTAVFGEVNQITGFISVSDSATAALTETAALIVLLARTEGVLISVSEVSLIAAIVEATDPLLLVTTETVSSLVAVLSRTDTLLLQLDEAYVLAALLSQADAAGIALSEVATILASLSRVDNLSPRADEESRTTAIFSAIDQLSVGVLDTADIRRIIATLVLGGLDIRPLLNAVSTMDHMMSGDFGGQPGLQGSTEAHPDLQADFGGQPGIKGKIKADDYQ